eukprot:280342-Prymnesium_polylepis.2
MASVPSKGGWSWTATLPRQVQYMSCGGGCASPLRAGTIERPSSSAWLGGAMPAISSIVGITSQKAHGVWETEPRATTFTSSTRRA